MKTALVLSGGGAKGAFQVGALEVLNEEGFSYDAVAGVSVGALNGTMVAADEIPRMIRIWKNVTREQIYKKKSVFELISKFGLYKLGLASPPKSIYSNDPLLHLLQRELKDIDLEIPLTVGRVYLETGEYFDEIDATQPRFILILLASTAIPVIWEPVMIKDAMFVDGGVRNITPIADVLDTKPDRIIVIPTNPLSGLKKDESIRDIVDIAQRALDILLNEIFLEDIKRCKQINRMVKLAEEEGVTLYKESGEPYKYYELTIIEPPEPLGNALDFKRERLDRLMAMGRQSADEVLGL